MKYLVLTLLSTFFFLPLQAQPLTVDVCVYGGTSAGVIAAYTAKKAGKSVLLIEPGRHLGGMSSGGLGQTDIGNKYAISGLSRDFYRRIGRHYGRLEQWTFEPSVAERIFNQYIKEAGVPVWYDYRIATAEKLKDRLAWITLEPASGRVQGSRTVRAKVFIDCSYEGDLMVKAGVSYAVGREAASLYGESYNGVQLKDKHQFPEGIDPYRLPGKPESGLLWGISPERLAPNGTGDQKLQAYNFRLCLTNNPANRIPITRPQGYDSTKFELLLRYIEKRKPNELNWLLMHIQPMPNQKTDINNSGPFSTDMIGANYDYPEASYERRAQIIREHEHYTKSFLYFLGNDPRVPEHLRVEMRQWGYPKDEYTDNGNFSPQLYVREARRMIGEYVMAQANCESRVIVDDGVGMAAYTMDSHNCQRIVVDGMVKNEGDVQVGGFPPYPVSYRALVPKRAECSNLLVPVCLSATHIAYGSIRMEPVFMVLAQSAAVAACLAVNRNQAVQDVDVKLVQSILRDNPLMDYRQPEILLDDADTTQIVTNGLWKRDSQSVHGRFGRSYLVAPAGELAAPVVEFSPMIPKTGKYRIYFYNLNINGQSPKTAVGVKAGAQKTVLTLDTREAANDWVLLGEYTLQKGRQNAVWVSGLNATGLTVADAVLFQPVN
ncbi:FAD-dependent oxidoreductase [Tellurirhabdus rosea]|uniref:FAD-dependent oxidoreductase n=1 Tax=Tellurirhabdus rosea TaxID=2674997 RepID=UPI00225071A7|nr:FAD-dependent oxidoreductase [Tellurirhabdus rosea]